MVAESEPVQEVEDQHNRTARNLNEFLDVLGTTQGSYVSLYRGHASTEHKVQPSVFRNLARMSNESLIVDEMLCTQPGEFQQDANLFEMLVRMQHYRAPTRLIDLSFNPLVALYFACSSEPIKDDGVVLRYWVQSWNIARFDGDHVEQLAQLAKRSARARNKLRLDIEQGNEGNKSELLSGTFVRPRNTNPRVVAQQGAFFLFGLDREPHDKLNAVRLMRIKIPSDCKPPILKQLNAINVNERALFPELEYTARYIDSTLPMHSVSDMERGPLLDEYIAEQQ